MSKGVAFSVVQRMVLPCVFLPKKEENTGVFLRDCLFLNAILWKGDLFLQKSRLQKGLFCLEMVQNSGNFLHKKMPKSSGVDDSAINNYSKC